MRKLLLLFVSVIVLSTADAADNSSQDFSSQHLREIIVEYPDSVLAILDRAEQMRPQSLPQFRIDLLRGLAYNEKRMYSLVERFASAALASDSIDRYPDEKLNAQTLLSQAQYYYGDFPRSIETATEAIKSAREIGNIPAELNLLTTMAKTSFDMGNRKQGYEYLDAILSRAGGTSSVRELANISAAYGVKVIELYADDRYDEALQCGYERLRLIDRIDKTGGAPEGYTDQQRAYTYARIASSAQCAGKTDEAHKAYDDFMATDYAREPLGRCFITDYLLESKQWNKVIEFTQPLYPIFEQYDTINNDFYSLLVSNAQAEAGLGNFRAGYALMSRAGAVKDSLYVREKVSKSQELATAFAMNEKDMALQKSQAESQRRHILMLSAFGIGVLILIILTIILIQYRATLRRNRIAAQQIDELMSQRERLHNAGPHTGPQSGQDTGLNEFQQMERTIMNERIFTLPDLNRDSLAEKCGMSRGRLIQLIQDNTGLTPNDYINKLRVEYSIKLIQQHPEWTIDAIAEGAGYVRRATYYSHFNKIFGITPAQYRKERTSGHDASAI